eukprot:CAMPEP_0194331576 /NCGR_PEP_ID=MMETSP0171-20130528/56031_1 /TAXON_ID=218684 /ORGANISM="Corethron pennatum, Strain L29A3" /LENGTH=104 /DNA_ID=CAMNT_0039093099 /DNA_START=14 /DNA_END=328 /DNA_ORIENTATION=-
MTFKPSGMTSEPTMTFSLTSAPTSSLLPTDMSTVVYPSLSPAPPPGKVSFDGADRVVRRRDQLHLPIFSPNSELRVGRLVVAGVQALSGSEAGLELGSGFRSLL